MICYIESEAKRIERLEKLAKRNMRADRERAEAKRERIAKRRELRLTHDTAIGSAFAGILGLDKLESMREQA